MKLPRQIRLIWFMLAFAASYSSCMPALPAASQKQMRVYIGTYTGASSKGVYVSAFDPANGKLSAPDLAAETKNPSFLAVHPNGRFLYAVGEVGSSGGKPAGAVSAFAIDGPTGKLALLNEQPSGGAGPCHLAVD
jgi:6-phosphogluconolactonase